MYRLGGLWAARLLVQSLSVARLTMPRPRKANMPAHRWGMPAPAWGPAVRESGTDDDDVSSSYAGLRAPMLQKVQHSTHTLSGWKQCCHGLGVH